MIGAASPWRKRARETVRGRGWPSWWVNHGGGAVWLSRLHVPGGCRWKEEGRVMDGFGYRFWRGQGTMSSKTHFGQN